MKKRFYKAAHTHTHTYTGDSEGAERHWFLPQQWKISFTLFLKKRRREKKGVKMRPDVKHQNIKCRLITFDMTPAITTHKAILHIR